jgi:hypothetical protein
MPTAQPFASRPAAQAGSRNVVTHGKSNFSAEEVGFRRRMSLGLHAGSQDDLCKAIVP